MGQYCFAGWRLSSVVVVCRRLSSSVTPPAGGRAGRRASGRSGGRHCTAGQYGYVPLRRHLVLSRVNQSASLAEDAFDGNAAFTDVVRMQRLMYRCANRTTVPGQVFKCDHGRKSRGTGGRVPHNLEQGER